MRSARLASLAIACASLANGLALAAPPDEPLSAAARAKTKAGCRAGDSGFFRDQGLVMKLASKLKFKSGLLMEQIDVKVNSGVATLTGGISTQQHIVMALNIAADVEGIHCINNFLRVGPPGPAPATTY